MPSRNEPCPCGSGTKYKRCCLGRLDVVARELRERATFLDKLSVWCRAEHRETAQEAGAHTALIRVMRGASGRGMSAVWALSDYRPVDGGPVLIDRYAARPELSEADRAIGRGLADASLDVYRVRSAAPGVWLELRSLNDDTSVRVAWRDGYEHFELGELLVARVVRATSLPTLWGPGARFPAGGERRWQARLTTLPSDPAEAALALLEFHPDDAAEPLPDAVEPHTLTWSIESDEAVLEAIEDDDLWKGLGQAIPDGWAFAWVDDADSSVADLGGWQDEPGEIEVARLIVCAQQMSLLSTDPRTMRLIASHLGATLGEMITPGNESLAA
jgi:hypothetical protein